MNYLNDYELLIMIKDMKSISDVCQELKIDYANVVKGTASKENISKVVNKMKVEITKMYSIIKFLEEQKNA